MNKLLLIYLALFAILSINLNAQSMYERFEVMQREMNRLKQEVATLKSNSKPTTADSSKHNNTVISSNIEENDDESEDGDDIATDEERISDLEESVSTLNRNTSGSHLKFKVDYRFSVENMKYVMADASEAKNDAFMTNRLWIDMGYKATNNLSFSAQLAYNKAFGVRSGADNAPYETIDWTSNENAYDDTLRVRSMYFYYSNTEFIGLDIPWTFSVGRRPSTNGHLVNLRDDDAPASPIGHNINVEFDGLSSKFTLNKDTGTSVKFCLGRGMSNAAPKFSSTPYATVADANPNIDIAGLIFVPFDNKQYSISSIYYYANNLIDMVDYNNSSLGFDTVGGLHNASINLTVKGIGNEWSDFLDYTTFFVSVATSVTDPKNGAPQGMLGSTKAETGSSYWVGAQFPSLFTEDGKWGVEYNQGSKYWRSITYGEDTNIGSKMAARGKAYEAYFTENLIQNILSLQIRYTYIDYEYSGSDGFFGSQTGTPYLISETPSSMVIDKAQDIRFYLRYRY